MAEEAPFWSRCVKCDGQRRHTKLKSHTESGDADYHSRTDYLIVRCDGCEYVSFRRDFNDFESGYPDLDEEGGWSYPTTTTLSPKFNPHRDVIDGEWHLPSLVKKVFSQSLLAIDEDARLLAGLGLRGTIEAVCNDRGVSGRDLEKRIATLGTQGLVSKRDVERLHAIRFLGNDAAHELKEPTKNQLDVAVKIIRHLLATVYVLESEVKGELETVISSISDLTPLLDEEISKLAPGDERSLAALAGTNLRRVKENLSALEADLMAAIGAGTYARLSLSVSATAQPSGSNKPIQLFRVV